MSQFKYFQVFGERNSGTNYLMKLMENNFTDIESTQGDVGFGWKHGDIGSDWPLYSKGTRSFYNHRSIQENSDTLFLVVYRNPFTWLQSMQRSPHHAPEMLNLTMDEFISRKWRSYYSPPGDDFSADKKILEGVMTKENLFENYSNVFELRAAKIKMHESFKDRVQSAAYINYETLSDNPKSTLQKIGNCYNLTLSSQFGDVTSEKFGDGKYKRKTYEPFSKVAMKKTINQINWNLESIIGYKLKKPYASILQKSNLISSKMLSSPGKLISIEGKVRCYINGEPV